MRSVIYLFPTFFHTYICQFNLWQISEMIVIYRDSCADKIAFHPNELNLRHSFTHPCIKIQAIKEILNSGKIR